MPVIFLRVDASENPPAMANHHHLRRLRLLGGHHLQQLQVRVGFLMIGDPKLGFFGMFLAWSRKVLCIYIYIM